jgi:hypothetical protein
MLHAFSAERYCYVILALTLLAVSIAQAPVYSRRYRE